MISTAQHAVVRNADVKYILLTGGISMYHDMTSKPPTFKSAPASIFYSSLSVTCDLLNR